jgi:uncharacterized protein YraI
MSVLAACVILAIALWAISPTTVDAQTQSQFWSAQYYNNPNLEGLPVLTRPESSISHFWGVGSPDPAVPSDSFSARWIKVVYFSAANYRFSLAGDDGVRFFIDSTLFIDQWHDQPFTRYSIDARLSAGLHTLRVEYYERTNQAAVQFGYVGLPEGVPLPGNPSYQWYGEYFAKPSLAGTPAYVRYDGQSGIQFDWTNTTPAPGIPHDEFSVRWTRQLCTAGRTYIFHLTVDDGARLYIGNVLIIDAWQVQPVATIQKPVDLTVGCYRLRLEYHQLTSVARISLTWNPPDGQSPELLAAETGTVPEAVSASKVSAIVGAGALNLRTGPGVQFKILAQVFRSQPLTVLARNRDGTWLQVARVDGLTGWVNTACLHIQNGNLSDLPVAGAGNIAMLKVRPTRVRGKLTSGLRLRTGPGTSYPEIATLQWGTVIDIVGHSADRSWLQVQVGDQSGWIYAPYVRVVSGDLDEVPVAG